MRAFESVFAQRAGREDGSGIVEMDINLWMGSSYLGRYATHFREPQEVGIVDSVPTTRMAATELREHGFSSISVAGDDDDPSAQRSEDVSCSATDAGGPAREDACLPVHSLKGWIEDHARKQNG
jgi:hypothetical protein